MNVLKKYELKGNEEGARGHKASCLKFRAAAHRLQPPPDGVQAADHRSQRGPVPRAAELRMDRVGWSPAPGRPS